MHAALMGGRQSMSVAEAAIAVQTAAALFCVRRHVAAWRPHGHSFHHVELPSSVFAAALAGVSCPCNTPVRIRGESEGEPCHCKQLTARIVGTLPSCNTRSHACHHLLCFRRSAAAACALGICAPSDAGSEQSRRHDDK